jgi:hypothetical protein
MAAARLWHAARLVAPRFIGSAAPLGAARLAVRPARLQAFSWTDAARIGGAVALACAGAATVTLHSSCEAPAPRMMKRIEDDYELGRVQLGEGNFATVVRGKCRRTGKDVAVKVVPKSKMTEDSIRHEVAVLQRVSLHKRIASLEALYEADDAFFIVME